MKYRRLKLNANLGALIPGDLDMGGDFLFATLCGHLCPARRILLGPRRLWLGGFFDSLRLDRDISGSPDRSARQGNSPR